MEVADGTIPIRRKTQKDLFIARSIKKKLISPQILPSGDGDHHEVRIHTPFFSTPLKFVGLSETEYSVPQSFTSSYGRTIVIHDNPRDQVLVEQPVLETPQTADNDSVDPVQPIPEIVEQPVEQHIP
ncbi:hypothetical protein ACH5RR_000608 [Cinchona calisaya]|uniref:Uncharacterized protein n=1 Tax=Cinchona calisaya TaxID=153742 RepID=A0ABD3B123_9GENT